MMTSSKRTHMTAFTWAITVASLLLVFATPSRGEDTPQGDPIEANVKLASEPKPKCATDKENYCGVQACDKDHCTVYCPAPPHAERIGYEPHSSTGGLYWTNRYMYALTGRIIKAEPPAYVLPLSALLSIPLDTAFLPVAALAGFFP